MAQNNLSNNEDQQQTPDDGIKLDQIPPELYDSIFKYISPNDLATASLTCRALKRPAESYFERKLRCGTVNVILNWGKIECLNREKYEIRFCSLIDDVNLRVYSDQLHLVKKQFKMVKSKCAKQFRRLALSFELIGNAKQCRTEDIDIIANQITDLETFYLRHSPTIDGFLRHCTKLQNLCIITDFSELVDEWTNTVHPNLKSLIIADLNEETSRIPINLTDFLKNAPQLQVIGISYFAAICSFLNSGCNVSNVTLWFQNASDLVNVLNKIESVYEQNLINTLHLGATFYKQFDFHRTFNRVRHLKMVKSFHFVIDFLSNEVDTFANIDVQPYVEVLCIHIRNQIKHLHRISQLFPNLKQLYITSNMSYHIPNYYQVVKSIASQNRQLKLLNLNFSIITTAVRIPEEDLININLARSKLVAPAFLTIETNFGVKTINLKFVSMMKLTQPDTWSCKMCRFYGFNPIYERYLSYFETLPIE